MSVTKVVESYQKLNECYVPISGRDWELWSPLLAIMHFLSDGKHTDLWDELVKYMNDYVKRKQFPYFLVRLKRKFGNQV